MVMEYKKAIHIAVSIDEAINVSKYTKILRLFIHLQLYQAIFQIKSRRK